jgi:hypothetical protein
MEAYGDFAMKVEQAIIRKENRGWVVIAQRLF